MTKLIFFLVLQFSFLFWLLYSKPYLNNKRIAFYSSLFFYLCIILFVIITKVALRNELDSFDLNKDGFFTGNEINPQQNLALENVSRDTNLVLAPVVGIIYSVIYFLILFVILLIFRKYKKIKN